MWLVVVVLALVCALAGWLFDVGLWWGPVALVATTLLAGLLTGLGSALTARLCGIRLDRVEVGAGRPLLAVRVGSTNVVVRWIPLAAGWIGAARTRSRLRLRFWLTHLGGFLCGAALIVLLARLPDGDARRGALVGAILVLIVAFVPATDEHGRSGPGWQLLTIPFLPGSAVNGWFVTERVSEATVAAERGDFGMAEGLLREAIADDPDEINAWLELSSVLVRCGRFVQAAEVTSEVLERPGLA